MMILTILTLIVSILSVLLVAILLLRKTPSGSAEIKETLSSFEATFASALKETEKTIREELARNRVELSDQERKNREELSGNFKGFSEGSAQNLKNFSEGLLKHIGDISRLQKDQLQIFATNLARLTDSMVSNLEAIRTSIDGNLKELREDNSKKLEEMRNVVDEKLHATLEKRLGESFKLVSDRLEQVHKGLGEMQTLASGVGDLKKVLSNVKTRGTWGEIQLGSLLEQILSKEQYAANVATKPGSQDRVEFAIRLPGQSEDRKEVWLPIDAKFPQEDYQRLVEAYDQANAEGVEKSAKQIEIRIKASARDIRDKYLDPPHTTDFGVMFIPIEGLFSEIVRRPGLCEKLQSEYRVVVAGPTTFAALLNSLQVGFKTLAIEKRSSEVWSILSAVKAEFGKFGDLLEKTRKKLEETTHTIDDAARKSRTIERKLGKVQEFPVNPQSKLLEETEAYSPETDENPTL